MISDGVIEPALPKKLLEGVERKGHIGTDRFEKGFSIWMQVVIFMSSVRYGWYSTSSCDKGQTKSKRQKAVTINFQRDHDNAAGLP